MTIRIIFSALFVFFIVTPCVFAGDFVKSEPLKCEIQTFENSRFRGKSLANVSDVESVEKCASGCWELNSRGQPCKSVNYFEKEQKCELMEDVWEYVIDPRDGGGSRDEISFDDDSSTYMIPIHCEKAGAAPAVGANDNIRPGSCGQTSKSHPQRGLRQKNRMIGGDEAGSHSVPWIVSIKDSTGHQCGGSLIRVSADKEQTDIVITAAHCWRYLSKRKLEVVVLAGAHNVKSEEGAEKFLVEVGVNHQNSSALTKSNDIAILKLDRPVNFSETIQPICLPIKGNTLAEGTNGILAGWGTMTGQLVAAETLQQLTLSVVDSEKCKKETKWHEKHFQPDIMLCAASTDTKKGACRGDSGGPFFTNGKDGFTLRGVHTGSTGCPGFTSGLYARITAYLDWIQEQVCELSDVAKGDKNCDQKQPEVATTNNIQPGSCGQTSTASLQRGLRQTNRIVGGNESIPHSVPWIVEMRNGTGHHKCGGSLIRVSPNREETDIFITAAHCWEGLRIGTIPVSIGAHNIITLEGAEELVVTDGISHPNFGASGSRNYTWSKISNDIAVLKLNQSVKFSDNIQPICLPNNNDPLPDGTRGVVSGWGTWEKGFTSETLKQVTVPVIGPDRCKTFLKLVDPVSMICAGYEQGGKDSCRGDSGGPYFAYGKNGFTLRGVVSFGIGCAIPRVPAIYTRVTTYVDWIQEQVCAMSDVLKDDKIAFESSC